MGPAPCVAIEKNEWAVLSFKCTVPMNTAPFLSGPKLTVNILETGANIDSKKGAELPGMHSKVMLLSIHISNSPSNSLGDGLHG